MTFVSSEPILIMSSIWHYSVVEMLEVFYWECSRCGARDHRSSEEAAIEAGKVHEPICPDRSLWVS